MTSYTISSSADLLRNFLQSEVLAPEAKFQALQTQAGASLLFSVGTDDVLYLTREVPGSKTGWDRTDISGSVTAGLPGSRCVDFGAAQCVAKTSTAIHLAMIIRDGRDDHLYLSLDNPDTDSSWAQAPHWSSYPFDNPDHKLPKVTIVNVFLSEATGKEYIVVDVLRDPASAQDLVYRYYVDPAKPGGYAWHPHDLAIDLSASGYTSCLGRKAGQPLDGLYTAGHVGGRAQLIYQPLYNPYGTTPPPPSRFSLPGGGTADAIAACRKSDNTSDLYLTSGSALYYLASKSQQDGAVAVRLTASPMFGGVRALFAAPSGSGVIVWGLNANDQVFYTICGGNPATGPWSVPLPIVTGAEQVSPYLDRALDANTFFCHTGLNQLTKAVKSPDTGMWTFSDITLEPPDTSAPARDVMSYTSTIQVADADGQPVSGVPVNITASNVTGVYINYLHYVAGPVTPVRVETGSDGTITIVEPVTSLGGSQLTVTAGDSQLTVNPMDNAFRKAAILTTPDVLSSARITSPNGKTRPLIQAGTSGADLQAVATANQALGQAYDARQAGTTALAARAAAQPQAALGGLDGLLTNAGDLLTAVGNAIADGVLQGIQVLVDGVTGVYNLVVQIRDQAYRAVLDRVESIAESIYQVLTMIVDDIKKVLEYLEFLFEWDDIARTKDALKTMIKLYLADQVSQIPALRAQLDQQITSAEALIADWAGHPEWAGLDASTPAAQAASAPAQSAPGSMLSYHYQNNAQQTTQLGPDPSTPSGEASGLGAVLEREGDTLYDAAQRLVDLGGRLPTTPLPDLLTELAAIISEALLESARNIMDAVLDLVTEAAQAVLKLLDSPIHIPVVSDVLNFFGVSDFSFLDLVCYLAAIPGTLLYKVVTGTAPFPAGPETDALIAAPNFPALVALYSTAPQVAAPRAAARIAPAPDAPAGDKAIHCIGHFTAGACAVVATPIMIREAKASYGNPLGKYTGLLGIIAGSGQMAAAVVANELVPYEQTRNKAWRDANYAFVSWRLWIKCCSALNLGVGGANEVFPDTPVDPRSLARIGWAWADAANGILSLMPAFYHCSELAQMPASRGRSIAIVDETSTITALVSRIAYATTLSIPPSPWRTTSLVVMGGTNAVSGALQVAEAFLVF